MKPITIRVEDGEPYLEGDWPDHVGFTSEFMAKPARGTKVEGDDIHIELANGHAHYRIVARDATGVEARLVMGGVQVP
jgi:glutamine synthetase